MATAETHIANALMLENQLDLNYMSMKLKEICDVGGLNFWWQFWFELAPGRLSGLLLAHKSTQPPPLRLFAPAAFKVTFVGVETVHSVD